MWLQGGWMHRVTTEVNETVPESICSIVRDFFVRLVALLQNALYDVYFAPQASKRVETAWEGSTRPAEAYNLQKFYLGGLGGEKWRSNLIQISPEATQEPEEQGPSQLWAAQGHTPGRAAQTARGPGGRRPGGSRSG